MKAAGLSNSSSKNCSLQQRLDLLDQGGTTWAELCRLCLTERLRSRISFAGEVLLEGRKMRAARVIKPLITFNSLAIYIGLGTAAVGRNALAKGKFKYDLTKLEGESRIWTEMVLLYTFFLFFFYQDFSLLCTGRLLPSCQARAGEVLLAECIRRSSVGLEVGSHSHQLKAELQIHRGKT